MSGTESEEESGKEEGQKEEYEAQEQEAQAQVMVKKKNSGRAKAYGADINKEAR